VKVLIIDSILTLVLNLIIKVSIEVVCKRSFGCFKIYHCILLETSKGNFHPLLGSWIFITFLLKLILGEVLSLRAHTETCKEKGVDRKGEEGSLGMLRILVVRVTDQVKRSYRVF